MLAPAPKTIDTLVDDIYALFTDPDTEFDPANVEAFGQRLAKHIANRITEERGPPTLRLSNLGIPCERKLWYSINTPELSEPLPPEARMKFLFGDILEELLLFLAKEAGHTVEGEQDVLDLSGVVGHRDAIIDGRIVDCKSASTYSYRKFAEGRLRDDDPFGYITQLGSYLAASRSDHRVVDKDVASFLVIDKTLGHITLDTHQFEDVNYNQVVEDKRAMLALPEPPPRAYDDQEDGKSGNRTLCVQCSYCPFKKDCWPGMRTFLYSTGPKFLTKVDREPKVAEVDHNGEIIVKF
jgi:hypothetical protein